MQHIAYCLFGLFLKGDDSLFCLLYVLAIILFISFVERLQKLYFTSKLFVCFTYSIFNCNKLLYC